MSDTRKPERMLRHACWYLQCLFHNSYKKHPRYSYPEPWRSTFAILQAAYDKVIEKELR